MTLPDSGDVARMRRIIARLRSYGVEVREMPGWETRGFRFPAVPTRIFDHHDASSRKSGEWGALGLILDGTPRGIPGPLSNFQVARCLDGKPRVAVVAAGFTYHAGTGGPYAELRLNNANPATYGAEKANDGIGEPYTAAADYATNALFHAAAVESGAVPASFPVGHKEWTPRKSDPTYSMPDRRRRVAAFTPSEDLNMPTAQEIASAVWAHPVTYGVGAPTPATMVLGDIFVHTRKAAGLDVTVDVDEAAIIAGLAPLMVERLSALSDEDVARLAKAAADEADRRDRERLGTSS